MAFSIPLRYAGAQRFLAIARFCCIFYSVHMMRKSLFYLINSLHVKVHKTSEANHFGPFSPTYEIQAARTDVARYIGNRLVLNPWSRENKSPNSSLEYEFTTVYADF